MQQTITPERILRLGMSFFAAKALLSAVESGVFTVLANGPLNLQTLSEQLGLHQRGARDFLDTLVALQMLERHNGYYANTPETERFLDKNKPSYIGGVLEMANARLYPFWSNLTEALHTGQPQNEARYGQDFFEILYSDPVRLKGFLQAMTGASMRSASVIAQKFPWQKYKTFVDIGAAQGCLSVQIALAHTHLSGRGFDLPPVQPIFEEYAGSFELQNRLRFVAGDFFKDDLPQADVVVMGHILHNWDLQQKQTLINKAYQALSEGGALIVYDTIIDDERCEKASCLLMSLNMLIETSGGFDYTGEDCQSWMQTAGFSHTYVEHLVGSDSMVVGIK